jgi:hypothetical protein
MSILTNHLRMATTGQRKPIPFLTTKVQLVSVNEV